VLGRLGVEQLRTRFGWVWSFVEARRLRAFLDQGKKPPPRLRKLTPPQIHLLAQSGYRNRDSFRGDVVLFRATRGNGDPGDEPFIDVFGDPRFGWQRSIAGNIECIDVPGGHFSMLAEPNVDALAAALQARLGRSTTPRASG
jgi:thioesterase domain-containing protein